MALEAKTERSEASLVPAHPLGPILLKPVLSERIWGVTTLPSWYAQPAPGKIVGEVWLTAEDCITNASATQLTLGELTAQRPELFGPHADTGFPLLIKLLLPREKLSVQVHPNDAQALSHGEPRGKTECWYVVSAEPGASLAVGFHDPITPSEIRLAIEDGTLEDKLRHIPVKAGDMVFIDAGTVHAIGPGLVVLETQQYSDTTYRLFDYGRPRELHIDAGLAVIRTSSAAGLVAPVPMNGFTRLISCHYFTVDRFSLAPGVSSPLENNTALQILVTLGEGCTLRSGDAAPTPLPAGNAVVLPAENTSYTLAATSAACDVIRILGERSH